MSKVDEMINADKPQYDFDFITRSLGLIPIEYIDSGGIAHMIGINPGAIASIERKPSIAGEYLFTITLHGGEHHLLDSSEMVILEATIKRRAAEGKELQKQAIKDNIQAQQEAVNELNRGVAAPILIGGPGKRKL